MQRPQLKELGGGWFELPNGEKVQGRTEAERKLDQLNAASDNVDTPHILTFPTVDTSFQFSDTETRGTNVTIQNPTRVNRYPTAAKEARPAVAILGFTETREQAPFGDPNFEIWGINELYRYHDVNLFHRWFEIHDLKILEPDKGTSVNGVKWGPHLEVLGQFPIPVYMQAHYDHIRPSVPFPKEDMEEYLESKGFKGKYMTSSIAWMMGLAILEGFEEVHVYGVDMAQETEYFEQRNCCEYWLGVMQGLGIKTHVPETSDLLKAVGQYGWGDDSEFRKKLDEREAWINEQLQQHEQAIAQVRAKSGQDIENLTGRINQLRGALQDVTYWKRSWSVPTPGNGTPHIDRSEDPKTGIEHGQDT